MQLQPCNYCRNLDSDGDGLCSVCKSRDPKSNVRLSIEMLQNIRDAVAKKCESCRTASHFPGEPRDRFAFSFYGKWGSGDIGFGEKGVYV